MNCLIARCLYKFIAFAFGLSSGWSRAAAAAARHQQWKNETRSQSHWLRCEAEGKIVATHRSSPQCTDTKEKYTFVTVLFEDMCFVSIALNCELATDQTMLHTLQCNRCAHVVWWSVLFRSAISAYSRTNTFHALFAQVSATNAVFRHSFLLIEKYTMTTLTTTTTALDL